MYAPALAVAASPDAFTLALSALPPLDPARLGVEAGRAHEDYLDNLGSRPAPGELDMVQVMVTMRERLPADAILTNGAGNFSVWAHRFYEFRRYRTQLAHEWGDGLRHPRRGGGEADAPGADRGGDGG